jgi:hypothetical protein
MWWMMRSNGSELVAMADIAYMSWTNHIVTYMLLTNRFFCNTFHTRIQYGCLGVYWCNVCANWLVLDCDYLDTLGTCGHLADLGACCGACCSTTTLVLCHGTPVGRAI